MGHENIIKNKKGSLVLRDIMFMLIIFSSVMALASIFVLSMAQEYSNDDMILDYYGADSIGDLGNNIFGNVSDSMTTMREETSEAVGSFQIITGAIEGIGAILSAVLLSPVYIKTAITTMLLAVNLPTTIATITGNIVLFLIYAVIIFVIISAFLRGGKV